jgi:hypothetical protein
MSAIRSVTAEAVHVEAAPSPTSASSSSSSSSSSASSSSTSVNVCEGYPDGLVVEEPLPKDELTDTTPVQGEQTVTHTISRSAVVRLFKKNHMLKKPLGDAHVDWMLIKHAATYQQHKYVRNCVDV